MSTFSTINAIPKPALNDPANIEISVNSAIDTVDTRLVARFSTTAARDAAIPSPTFGQIAAVSGTSELYMFNGSVWTSAMERFNPPQSSNQNSSTTTLANATGFVLAVEANSKYAVRGVLCHEGAAGSDMKYGWVVPASSTGRYTAHGANGDLASAVSASAMIVATQDWATTIAFGTLANPTATGAIINGVLITAGSAGSIQLQIAQFASAGTVTFLAPLSFLALTKIA